VAASILLLVIDGANHSWSWGSQAGEIIELHACIDTDLNLLLVDEQESYKEMTERIDSAVMLGKVPEEIKAMHKGFYEWDSSEVTSQNHQPIVQVVFYLSSLVILGCVLSVQKENLQK